MPYSVGYTANPSRYERMPYRRSGRSGLDVPAISLGLWQNFGGIDVFETGRAILRRAFDLGVTHFDLANNYGPPYGSAEENFGRVLAADFKAHRDELLISTKAGWDMWPGPYGDVGGSRKYLIASCDQSLRRMGVDYVDIFYSHRVDPRTPLEETMGALAHLHRQGKALYLGVSSYSPELTRKAHAILKSEGVPLLIHQPSYSMLNRWIETEGLLSDRYLNGVPADARVNREKRSLAHAHLSEENLAHVRELDAIARGRGQSLAQMAIAWTLRDPRVTSALVGARTVAQLEDSLAAVDRLDFTGEELAAIDEHAVDGAIDLWKVSSRLSATDLPAG